VCAYGGRSEWSCRLRREPCGASPGGPSRARRCDREQDTAMQRPA
jgi:hypothetical protein